MSHVAESDVERYIRNRQARLSEEPPCFGDPDEIEILLEADIEDLLIISPILAGVMPNSRDIADCESSGWMAFFSDISCYPLFFDPVLTLPGSGTSGTFS